MKKGLVISDTGPIISLAIVNKLHLLEEIFEEVNIPLAVWNELTLDPSVEYYERIVSYFEAKVKKIRGFNELTFIMGNQSPLSYIENSMPIIC